MKKIIIAAAVALVSISANAQPKPAQPEAEYQFTVVKENPITSVKNQYRSSTCWCFSALGFLESEAIRIKNIKDTTLYPDFSEMFVVSHSYKDRAVKYVRTDGHINFAAGSEADDVLHVIEDYGLVPQDAMPGLQPLPIHGELDATTKAYVEASPRILTEPFPRTGRKALTPSWTVSSARPQRHLNITARTIPQPPTGTRWESFRLTM